MVLTFTTTERVEIWVAMASGAVAAATLVLALMTRRMARKTADLAKETKRVAQATEDLATHAVDELKAVERQADAAREQVEALTRPWLTDVPDFEHSWRTQIDAFATGHNEPSKLSLHLRNAGQGLALAAPGQCYMREYSPDIAGPGTLQKGLVTPTAVSAQGIVRIQFLFSAEEEAPWRLNPFLVELFTSGLSREMRFLVDVLFTDAAGGQATWARIHMLALPQSMPAITRIDYLHDESGNPVVPAFQTSEVHLG